MEHLLVQRLIRLFRSHRQKYIPADEFMNDLTVRGLALKDNIVFRLFELDHHVLHLPVYVPCLCINKTSIVQSP